MRGDSDFKTRYFDDFLRLAILAFVIAAPIGWWAAYKCLQNYECNTNMTWWIFALSGFPMLFIVLITLSTQTIKAATENPGNKNIHNNNY